mgnify:CR=1 FL=1
MHLVHFDLYKVVLLILFCIIELLTIVEKKNKLRLLDEFCIIVCALFGLFELLANFPPFAACSLIAPMILRCFVAGKFIKKLYPANPNS